VTDIFNFDSKYLENEERYKSIKAEILGEDSDDESGIGSDEDDSEGRKVNNMFFIGPRLFQSRKRQKTSKIETNLLNLRHAIYLTIMNALNYEEAVPATCKMLGRFQIFICAPVFGANILFW
jgi:pre-mRNA-splicing factor CWC22